MNDLPTPIFGEILDGITYLERPGAYAFLQNSSGEWAVVRTTFGYFLPGGGVDPGESIEAALERELLEEIGYRINKMSFYCKAVQYHWSAYYQQYFKKIGTFFEIEALPFAASLHDDHALVWLPAREACLVLTQEFQRWALKQVAEP